MEVFEAVRGRRSVRAFAEDTVSAEDVRRLIEAARWAPSAGNIQPWEFVIITEMQTKRGLSVAALNQRFIEEAPVVLVVYADMARSAKRYGSRGARLYCLQDTAAAAQNILLVAHAMGLGACWVGAFDEDAVKTVLQTPRNVRPVAIIPVGHPAERPRAPPKRSIGDIIHYETF